MNGGSIGFSKFPFSFDDQPNVLLPNTFKTFDRVKGAFVKEIKTISENNTTLEEYDFSVIQFNHGAFSAVKTFRPESTSCTS